MTDTAHNEGEKYRKFVYDTAAQQIKDIDVFHNQILVAHFVRSTVGHSGKIIAPGQTRKEDRFQGKCGLVLKVGPAAFVDDAINKFYDVSVKEGDWVVYRNTDGWDFDIIPPGGGDKVECRFLEDAHIKGRVSRPDILW